LTRAASRMIQSSRNRGEIGDEAITPRPDGTPTVAETLAEIAQLADAAADIASRFLRDRGMATEVAGGRDAGDAHEAYLQAVVQNAGHAIITVQAALTTFQILCPVIRRSMD